MEGLKPIARHGEVPEKAKRALDKKAEAIGATISTYYQVPMAPSGSAVGAPMEATVFIGDIGMDMVVTFTAIEGKATVEPKYIETVRQ